MSIKAVFLVPIFTIALAAALHAPGYLKNEPKSAKLRFWIFFPATVLAMAAVVFAGGKLSFILAWEAMGLASAALVALESESKSARQATWIYLLACHAGACALMLAGILSAQPTLAGVAFACAVVGFGLKIGFPPFHSWLPEAHPAAPAPASAIMSGAMIPLGAYGLLAFTENCLADPLPKAGIGWTLLVLGAAGTLGGILFAAPQSNLKRLLAFSSIENMGIVTLALGLHFLCRAYPCTHGRALADLALAGGLAHVVNHALLKGALFLGAGSLLRQTGTLDLDRMGGLMQRMPITGRLIAVNAMGLAGLPPLNGFVGELVIYVAAFYAIASGVPALVLAGFAAAVTLALAGGIAAAVCAKIAGTALLGEYRGEAPVRETPPLMWIAQLLPTALSIAMVPGTVFFTDRMSGGFATRHVVAASCACILLAALTLALAALRRLCPRGGEITGSPTWDCGYHAPTPRMAYTATSFTEPIATLFRPLLRSRKHVIPFEGDPAKPTDAAIAVRTDDLALAGLWRPAFTFVARLFQRAHLLQSGSIHLYILIILIAVLILLAGALCP